MKILKVDNEVIQEAQNIIDKVYWPLEGFLREKDFHSVCDKMRLSKGDVWPMPIVFSVDERKKDELLSLSQFVIQNKIGAAFVIKNPEFYFVERKSVAEKIFGTGDEKHPGVQKFLQQENYFIGGEIISADNSNLISFKNYFSPNETKNIFKKFGWSKIAAFQTRNPPHLSHEFLQRKALEVTDGLLIQPIIGDKKKGDIDNESIIETYRILIKKHYSKENVFFNTFNTFMRYAGPREAVFHALVRRNFGCTHMIIGRDHAGVGNYYQSYASHDVFDQFSKKDLRIDILKYDNACYCKQCSRIVFENDCEHEKEYLSGSELRSFILNGTKISENLMHEEISRYLRKRKNSFIK